MCGWEGRCVREEARRVSCRSKVQVRRQDKTIQLGTRSWVRVRVQERVCRRRPASGTGKANAN